MCTIGAVATVDPRGRPVVFAAKTKDRPPGPHWHGAVTGGGGHDVLGFNTLARAGISAGVNRAGLAIVTSYLGYGGPFEADAAPERPPRDLPLDPDRRPVITAAVLGRCGSVEEALACLHELAPRHGGRGSEGRGHDLLLADARGRVAAFECFEERASSRLYPEGYTARGNNGLLILEEEQGKMPEAARRDREVRCGRMLEAVREVREGVPRGMRKEEALAALKEVLSWHGPEGGTAPGAVCAHGVRVPGARSNHADPCWTVTAAIFDPIERLMHYTPGNPCQVAWRELTFPS